MDSSDVTNQALVERQILTHIGNALREALKWETVSSNFARKLSTLRFVGSSFQRHLDRLRALNEYEGYLQLVLETKPHLTATVTELQAEHDHFQEQLDRVMFGLDRVAQDDTAGFEELCGGMSGLLDGLKRHNEKVSELLQSAFVQEEGGMG